eukprot:4144048-Alexandrium_andersonii.AAC.1
MKERHRRQRSWLSRGVSACAASGRARCRHRHRHRCCRHRHARLPLCWRCACWLRCTHHPTGHRTA